jgi:hypothetical protein
MKKKNSSKSAKQAQPATIPFNKLPQSTHILVHAKKLVQQDIDGKVIFGAVDVIATIGNQTYNLTASNPDKFQVIADDHASATREFFDRWRLYVNKRFNRPFINLFFTGPAPSQAPDTRRTSDYSA